MNTKPNYDMAYIRRHAKLAKDLIDMLPKYYHDEHLIKHITLRLIEEIHLINEPYIAHVVDRDKDKLPEQLFPLAPVSKKHIMDSILFESYLDWNTKCEPEQIQNFQDWQQSLFNEIEDLNKPKNAKS